MCATRVPSTASTTDQHIEDVIPQAAVQESPIVRAAQPAIQAVGAAKSNPTPLAATALATASVRTAAQSFEESLTTWCNEKIGNPEYDYRVAAAKEIRKCYYDRNRASLDLSNNQLTTIPEVIGSLTSLMWLNLSRNRLTSIPEVIGNLTALEKLNLYENRLNSIPKAIGSLTALTWLDLCKNQLTSLPEPIGSLTALTYLVLSENQLTSIPEALSGLTALTVLDLSRNRLTSFPKTIGNLTSLRHLNLHRNQLTSFPEEIVSLAALTYLGLFENQLTSIPEGICRLTSLTELNLSLNSLTSLPVGLCRLTSLTQLDLSCNGLTSLPNQILELPPTCEIDMENAGLSENVLHRLQEEIERRTRDLLPVPTIRFSMPAPLLEEGEIPLDEIIPQLYQLLERTPEDLSLLKDSDTNNHLRMWLNRLSWTATYKRKGETQKSFISNIVNYLEEAERNPKFRTLFFRLIEGASATCGDRVALSVITVGIQHDLIKFDLSNTKGLAEFLIRGQMSMGLLEEYARQIVPTFRFIDEIEVYLGLPIMLREKLHLPINQTEMLYYRCSCLTDRHLAQADSFVRVQIDDPETHKQFLINHETWLKALEQQYPEEFVRIMRNYNLSKNEEGADLLKVREDYENALKDLTQRAML